MIFDFMMPFERAHFKLPEKHKIFEIGTSKLKLWQLILSSLVFFVTNSVTIAGNFRCVKFSLSGLEIVAFFLLYALSTSS